MIKGKIAELKKKANYVRTQVLDMCVSAGTGHLASSFSCVEILVALYYGGVLRFDPANPDWEERDRFIISKGHGAIALYPVLADLGFFSRDELSNFCHGDGILGAHPDSNIPGIEVVSGSLGHGLGIATGLALSAKMDGKDFRTIALLGDGECYEGAVWEAAMFAAHHELNNLTGIIDRNGLSVMDFTEKNLRLDPLEDKWKSFGWHTTVIDGHSFEDIISALKSHHLDSSTKPLMIIANTIKGKGVSFMEGKAFWHTRIPAGEQLRTAREELSSGKSGATTQGGTANESA